MGYIKNIFLAVFIVLMVPPAIAQTQYPQRPIQIVVGFPPGAAPDAAARLLGNKLSRVWKVPVIVENVTGASGTIAATRVARADKDGYTLLMAGSAAIVINPSLYESLPFDSVKDFTPITEICATPNLLVSANDLPIKDIASFVAFARANPGKLSYASAGTGTSQHLAGELFKSMAHVDLTHVPYRGGPSAIPDLLVNRVSAAFANINDALPMVRDGKLRALAITSPQRSPFVPNVPTMVESGFPDFDMTVWFGLMAPAGTPGSVVEKINAEVVKALGEADVQRAFSNLGLTAVGSSSAEFASLIKTEIPRWKALIQKSGAKLN